MSGSYPTEYYGKILLVGNTYSGKTSWINRIQGKEYHQFKPTRDYYSTYYTIPYDRDLYRTKIYDTSGQKGSDEIIEILHEQIDVVLIFVNLSHQINVNQELLYYIRLIEEFEEELREQFEEENHIHSSNDVEFQSITKIIVGNRIDEAYEEMPEIMRRITKEMKIPYIEMSVIDDTYFHSFIDIIGTSNYLINSIYTLQESVENKVNQLKKKKKCVIM